MCLAWVRLLSYDSFPGSETQQAMFIPYCILTGMLIHSGAGGEFDLYCDGSASGKHVADT